MGDLPSQFFSISKGSDSTAFLGNLLSHPTISVVRFPPPLLLKRISRFPTYAHHFSCQKCVRYSVLFLWEKPGSVISASFYLADAESIEIAPSPSPLKAEQTKFSQPLLMCHVLILLPLLWTCSTSRCLSTSFLQRGA